MDVRSTHGFGSSPPLPPQIEEQEPTDVEHVRKEFANSSIGAKIAGRSMSFKDTSQATAIKTKRASLPVMPYKTPEVVPRRKGSLLDRLRPSRPEPEMQNGYIECLLKYDEWLLTSTEILANSCKNFSCINLNVPPDMLVGDFSEALFQSLSVCLPLLTDVDAKPTVLGKEVEEKDCKSLKNLILQIQVDEIWTRLFHEMVQRRDDKKNCRIFLSPAVCKALLMMKTKEEIDKVSMHLMSECTDMDHNLRLINFTLFPVLLHDERIASLPVLRKALIDAAHKVMVAAIRLCQNEIAFDALKGIPKRQELAAKWREKAKGMGPDHLDLKGIEAIAKECEFNITIHLNPEDKAQQNYQRIVDLYKELCAAYN